MSPAKPKRAVAMAKGESTSGIVLHKKRGQKWVGAGRRFDVYRKSAALEKLISCVGSLNLTSEVEVKSSPDEYQPPHISEERKKQVMLQLAEMKRRLLEKDLPEK
jgi:hypothetical protein